MTGATGEGPDDRPDDGTQELAAGLEQALEPLGRMPPAPTWLTTRLTAEFRRRRGELDPVRDVRLAVVSDTRTSGLVGVRAAGTRHEEDYTIHLRSDLEGAPEVVLDVRTEEDGLSVDGLVFGGNGVAYHARSTTGSLVRDADDTSGDGRFSFRGLATGRHRLVLDDGHDRILAEVDLSTGQVDDDDL